MQTFLSFVLEAKSAVRIDIHTRMGRVKRMLQYHSIKSIKNIVNAPSYSRRHLAVCAAQAVQVSETHLPAPLD